jgi:hypothetical protein
VRNLALDFRGSACRREFFSRVGLIKHLREDTRSLDCAELPKDGTSASLGMTKQGLDKENSLYFFNHGGKEAVARVDSWDRVQVGASR